MATEELDIRHSLPACPDSAISGGLAFWGQFKPTIAEGAVAVLDQYLILLPGSWHAGGWEGTSSPSVECDRNRGCTFMTTLCHERTEACSRGHNGSLAEKILIRLPFLKWVSHQHFVANHREMTSASGVMPQILTTSPMSTPQQLSASQCHSSKKSAFTRARLFLPGTVMHSYLM